MRWGGVGEGCSNSAFCDTQTAPIIYESRSTSLPICVVQRVASSNSCCQALRSWCRILSWGWACYFLLLISEECYSNFSLFIQYHQCMQDIVKECNKKKQNYIKLLPISGHRSGCRWTKSKWEWGLNRRSTTLIPKMKYFHLRWYNARRNFEKKEEKK